jgi:hypothetical protein
MLLKHLIRLLTLFALLLAPLGMLGGASAIAAPPRADASAGSSHCAEMASSRDQSSDEQTPAKSIECMMSCMMLCSGLPSMTPQLAEPVAPSPMAAPVFVSSRVRGLTPQAEPRPPKLS